MEKIELLKDEAKRLDEFISKTEKEGKKLVLITSGGCSVRLEKNTVRMIENFSTGTRGALSAEFFLLNEYNVIFYYRDKSNLPFIHKLNTERLLLDEEYINSDLVKETRNNLKKFKNHIFYLPYTTFDNYHNKLYILIEKIKILKNTSIIYLAAAISDFIIPEDKLSEHKIQSKDEEGISKKTLELTLYPAPKDLYKIKEGLNKDSMLVTFKLETNEDILKIKSYQAIKKTNCDLVVANVMDKRYDEIHLYINSSIHKDIIHKPIYKKENNVDVIEEKIVSEIINLHCKFINGNY